MLKHFAYQSHNLTNNKVFKNLMSSDIIQILSKIELIPFDLLQFIGHLAHEQAKKRV